MAKKKLFISFAADDRVARDKLVKDLDQVADKLELTSMLVKKPAESSWKDDCRKTIKRCDGVIALISRHSNHAQGQLWELKCARDLGTKVRGVYTNADNKPEKLASDISSIKMITWAKTHLESFIDSL